MDKDFLERLIEEPYPHGISVYSTQIIIYEKLMSLVVSRIKGKDEGMVPITFKPCRGLCVEGHHYDADELFSLCLERYDYNENDIFNDIYSEIEDAFGAEFFCDDGFGSQMLRDSFDNETSIGQISPELKEELKKASNLPEDFFKAIPTLEDMIVDVANIIFYEDSIIHVTGMRSERLGRFVERMSEKKETPETKRLMALYKSVVDPCEDGYTHISVKDGVLYTVRFSGMIDYCYDEHSGLYRMDPGWYAIFVLFKEGFEKVEEEYKEDEYEIYEEAA